MEIETLIENCEENGHQLMADFLRWTDKLFDATPSNVDKLLSDFEAWTNSVALPPPREFMAAIRESVFYFAERDRPH